MNEWQTIESAPKDGSYVIVSGIDWEGSSSACWFGGEWLSKPPLGASFIKQPTHWRPFPPRPTREAL